MRGKWFGQRSLLPHVLFLGWVIGFSSIQWGGFMLCGYLGWGLWLFWMWFSAPKRRDRLFLWGVFWWGILPFVLVAAFLMSLDDGYI